MTMIEVGLTFGGALLLFYLCSQVDEIARSIARCLPRRVVYWAFVHVMTTDQCGQKVYVGDLSQRTCLDAQKGWHKTATGTWY